MRTLANAALATCLAAGLSGGAVGSVNAADALIGPDAWRALTTGKTLYYHKDGELYGREFYRNEEGDVVFEFPGGQCAEGRWAWAEDKYCFAFGGQLHCFSHVMRDGEIVVIGLEDGEEQTVETIADNEPLTCEEGIES
ncbi:MAG: hypothetical protein AAF360_01530 [Pseudomonadota bacterium]